MKKIFLMLVCSSMLLFSCSKIDNEQNSLPLEFTEENFEEIYNNFVAENVKSGALVKNTTPIHSAKRMACGPEAVDYLDCSIPPTDFTFTVNHPSSCDVEITLRVTPCQDFAPTVPIVYMSFEMVDINLLNVLPGSPCFNFLIGLINGPNPNEAIDQFLDELKADAEAQFMTAWVLANPGAFPCIGAVMNLQANFFSAACTQRCLVFEGGLALIDEPCDEEGCCMKVTEWCENPDGSVSNGGGSGLELISRCTNEGPPTIFCKKGIIWGGEGCIDQVPNCEK